MRAMMLAAMAAVLCGPALAQEGGGVETTSSRAVVRGAPADAADGYTIRSQADLQAYIDAFNARDYATQIRYYADDVAFDVGDLKLRSPQEIADFYDDFHDYVDEHVEIARFAQTGDTVAIVVPTRFEARETYDRNGLLFEAGSVRDSVSLVFYDLRDGKIWRVRMARYAGPASDFE